MEKPDGKCEPTTGTAQEDEEARGEPQDSGKSNPESERAAEHPLDKAFVARVVIYAGGLAAGLGIKAVDRPLLVAQLSDSSQKAALKSRVMDRASQAVSDAGVTYGLDAEALSGGADSFVAALETGEEEMVSRKIAEGEAPTPGEDARLEYLLNPDNLPMHKVQDTPENSTRTWIRMVREGETLVQVYPAQPGQSGVDVKGEPVEPKKPREASLEGVTGERTAVDGDRLIAESDGACEENARGVVRVVPEVEVESVDSTTGSLPEAGVSNANVLVRKAVCSGVGVASSEAVFVGAGPDRGTVEQSARLSAKSLVVNGPLLGPYDTRSSAGERNTVEVQETCAARTLRQFRDLLNARKVAERSCAEIGLAIKQMQDDLSEQGAEASDTSILIQVRGRVHLDASLEASLLVEEEEALALQLTYVVEGKRFRNHTLQDLKGELGKQVRAYLEKESAQVDERRQAIDQMFKDADQRPAGPEIRHRRFELPFTWTPGEEEEEDGEDVCQLQVTTTAWVDSGEPDTLYVQSEATPRQTLSGLEVRMQQEGPKVSFLLSPCEPAKVRWKQDSETRNLLSGIVVRGVSAWSFLMDSEIPDVVS